MARKPVVPAAAMPVRAQLRSVGEARQELLERSARNARGGASRRSDPAADVRAARTLAAEVRAHEAELRRRGLSPHHVGAALELASELEERMHALPAAALAARARSPETAELLADAAATAHAAREAVARVARGLEGRAAAAAFGLGEPFNARQASHVLGALRRLLDAAQAEPAIAADAGLLPEDLQTMRDLMAELERLPDASAFAEETAQLVAVQGALRAFFDLVSAKSMLAFAGDPEERGRILSLVPRAEDRRHASVPPRARNAFPPLAGRHARDARDGDEDPYR